MSDTTTRVGRYQLLEPIGTGPCGVVSRAKVFGVAGFERQFAVKKFHPELTITNALAQALSSAARSYGSLEHPRIARMSEFGVAQGQTFTAVEYVAGLDAARLVAEARLAGLSLASGGVLALVSQAARAVGYAHGRGLTHLGLSPTNVIINADGDVKITDFGILAAGLPQRPVDVARLQHRIQYLAPEQVANEATSAATDVFALGVIAYELVTGQRTFRGDTAQQIAQSIMAGPPPEPALPRPIVRVLQRCLARSPFERFPDARALADALDAALRVAPVPGTRKDIGSQVKQLQDKLAALHENEMSGMVALHVGTGPIARQPAPDVPALGRDPQQDVATAEFVRPDVPVPGPTPLVGPGGLASSGLASSMNVGATLPDLPKPTMTLAGIAPPPIPIPPGAVTLSPAPPPPPRDAPATLIGLSARVPVIPSIKPVPSVPSVPPVPPVPKPPGQIPTTIPMPRSETQEPTREHDPSRPDEDHEIFDSVTAGAAEGYRIPDEARRPLTPSSPPQSTAPALPRTRTSERDIRTSEMSPLQSAQLQHAAATTAQAEDDETDASSLEIDREASGPTAVAEAAAAPMPRARRLSAIQQAEAAIDIDMPDDPTPIPPPVRPRTGGSVPPVIQQPGLQGANLPPVMHARASEPVEGDGAMPSLAAALPMAAIPDGTPLATMPGGGASPKRRSAGPIIAIVILLGGAGAAIAAWQMMKADDGDTKSTAGSGGSSSETGGTKPSADAAQVAIIEPDASTTKSADAGTTKAADAGTKAVDAGTKVAAIADAGKPDAAVDAGTKVAIVVDAGTKPADAAVAIAAPPDAGAKPVANGGSADTLAITSTPAGARVYLDGSDAGVTPLKLPGSPDKHTVALLLAGHDLYISSVDGHGAFTIALKEVTPSAGPAGIKILKCKDKDRYYVYVDSKPTGMMCPTERIETDVGPHTVEVYDAVTESKKKWDIVVKDTRLSYRVKLE